MKIKFNNEEQFRPITGYFECNPEYMFSPFDMPENLSGFVLYEDDEETIIGDYSDYIYRYNIHSGNENNVIYTNDPDKKEPEPDPNFKPVIIEMESMGTDELTTAVADLMMEVDMMKMRI